MLAGDKVRYFGSITERHGIYTIIWVPPVATRGYVLENENGLRLRDVSINSIAHA